MIWISISELDLRSVLSGAELSQYRSLAQGGGDPDPVAGTIADVVAHVRGYVAAKTALGPDGQIPDTLKICALDLLAVRIPQRVGKAPLEVRKAAAERAQKRLETLTQAEFSTTGAPPMPTISGAATDRTFTRDQQQGI